MRSSLLCGLLTLSSLVAAGRAAAEPAVPVLALPTLVGGYVPDRAGWQREFDQRLEQAIRRAGRAPRPPGPLTTAEASCRDAECLAKLAEGANVGIVLGARVTADKGSPPSYKLVLTRYDHDRPGVVRQEEAECSVCTELEAAERLEHMVVTMLPSLVVQHPRVAPVEAPPPVVEPVVAPTLHEDGLTRRTLYALLGGTIAADLAGIAMVGVGAHGLVIDGTYVHAPRDGDRYARDRYDTSSAGSGLLAAGAVIAIGATVGIVFELRALKRSKR